MYRIEDRTSAVMELQRLLRVNPTGMYDSKTRAAVLNVQKNYRLEQTGIADYLTFSAAVDEYRIRVSNKWTDDYLFSPVFPYKEGDMDENVGRINDALRIILDNYAYEGIKPKGNYFGDNTLNGMLFLRRIFGLEESEVIDEIFMNRTLIEREAIEVKNKYGL